MIFVTVGSFSFDTLVREIDTQVAQNLISMPITMQIGTGSYEPKHCAYFRSAPGLDEWYQNADLVIGHGGTGTTLEILERGIRQISVCNPELIDNHQHDFLAALAERNLVNYCRNLSELPHVIHEVLAKPPPTAIAVTHFFKRLIDDIDTFPG